MAAVRRVRLTVLIIDEERIIAPLARPMERAPRAPDGCVERVVAQHAAGRRRGAYGRTGNCIALLCLASLIAPPPAHAYVDPLSGSVVFQVIVAAGLGALFTVRRWWTSALAVARSLVGRFIGR
jgi:hypothetical protein